MLLAQEVKRTALENDYLEISPAYVLIGLAIAGGAVALFVIAAAIGLF